MLTYVKVYFSTEGPSPIKIAEKVSQVTGLAFVRGEQDIVFEWKTNEEYEDIMERIFQAFQGSKAFLKYETMDDAGSPVHLLAQWPPSGRARPDARRPEPHPHRTLKE